MSRIADAIVLQKQKGHAALIPFITAGDPSYALTLEIVSDIVNAGADVIELGVPYSDPIADGPVIQAASLRALDGGFQLPNVFTMVESIRERKIETPIVLFTYANPIFQYGIESFLKRASEAGADGVIIPDLPIEESEELLVIADQYGIDVIPLVAPTSKERVEKICKHGRGFVYCVSSLGVTGERAKFADNLDLFLSQVRDHATIPVGVGFGISTPEQAKQVAKKADAVIIGSAIVRRVGEIAAAYASDQQDTYQTLRAELREYIHACKEAIEGSGV